MGAPAIFYTAREVHGATPMPTTLPFRCRSPPPQVGRDPTFESLASRAPCVNRGEFGRAARDLGMVGELCGRADVDAIYSELVRGPSPRRRRRRCPCSGCRVSAAGAACSSDVSSDAGSGPATGARAPPYPVHALCCLVASAVSAGSTARLAADGRSRLHRGPVARGDLHALAVATGRALPSRRRPRRRCVPTVSAQLACAEADVIRRAARSSGGDTAHSVARWQRTAGARETNSAFVAPCHSTHCFCDPAHQLPALQRRPRIARGAC
jgi:hypothetical protein